MTAYPDITSADAKTRVMLLSPRNWFRKRRCDRIVKKSYWSGFQDGVSNNLHCALEYVSTSGLYGYNPAHKIAYDAGYDCGQAIRNREHERRLLLSPWSYEVPGKVFRECYDAIHIR